MGNGGHDVAWAAGLFEGEGCVYLDRPKRGNRRLRLALSLSSTDEDVVRAFATIMGVGTVAGPYMPPKGTKQCWVWRVRNEEDCDVALNLLYRYLGTRRKATILTLREEKEQSDRDWRPREKGRRPGVAVSRGQMGMLG